MKTIITTIAALVLTMTTFAQKVNPMIVSVSLTQPSCYGYSNGQISVTPNGGLAPYTYLWSNGETTQSISNLPAGNYSVTINDAMGNTIGGFITVPQPQQITISANVTNTPMNTSNGVIDILSVDGAVGNYSYNWSSNNGQTMDQSSLDQSGLKSGSYKLSVIDEMGCQVDAQFQVTNIIVPISNPNFIIHPFTNNNSTSISTYPNPSDGNFTIDTKEFVNQVKVVNTTTGEAVVISSQDKINVKNLPTGVYMIYVTTEKGTEVERVTVL